MKAVATTTTTKLPGQVLALVAPRGGALQLARDISPAAALLASCSPASLPTYRASLRRVARLFNSSLDALNWDELRFAHVEWVRQRLQLAGAAPATINSTLCVLREVARRGWQLGQLSAEDYARIKDVRGVRGTRERRGRALSGNELSALLNTCARDRSAAGARDACLLALLAGAGLRRAEAASLDFADYDSSKRALLVRGKGDRERVVYFAAGGAAALVADWLSVRGAAAGALLCPVSKSGVIALRRISAQAIYRALHKRSIEAGLRHVAPHDLRRTFATALLDHGADVSSVQALLGHANVDTTLLYDRRGERAKQQAAARLPWYFSPKRRRKRSVRKSRRKKRSKF